MLIARELEDGTLVPVFERPRAKASEPLLPHHHGGLSAAARGAGVPRMDPERGRGRGPHRTRPRPAPAVIWLRLPFSPPAPRALSRNTGGFLSRTRLGGTRTVQTKPG